MLASIPSPDSNALRLGDLQIRFYGLSIMLGVVAAVWLASARWRRRGGSPEDIQSLALWTVPAGLVGARLYHVLTDWKSFRGRWLDAFAIWQGGLGIPGAIAVGMVVGVVVARRRGLPVPALMDVVAPALPLAQAIGRLGNWFNQELFGRPTDLPWGLEIDVAHRPIGYEHVATFHPTFLYEALWNLALCGVLLLVDRRGRLRAGQLFWLYVLGYGLGRLWVEELRIDPASLLLGVRINIWTSGLAVVAALVVLVVRARRGPAPGDELPAPADGARSEDDADDDGSAERAESDGARSGAPRVRSPRRRP